jgi:hypothetical protein
MHAGERGGRGERVVCLLQGADAEFDGRWGREVICDEVTKIRASERATYRPMGLIRSPPSADVTGTLQRVSDEAR